MPNYEYRCLDCKKRFLKFLTYQEYGTLPVACPLCFSQRVDRIIGRVRTLRTEQSRLENLSDPSKLEAVDDDPRALGRMMREMSHEVGEDLPPEFNEVVGRLEAGQSPEDIERDLPDLAGGDAPAGGSMDDF